MRIGYSYWGFLGDHKEDEAGNELSTPDGNAAYSWAIIHEARKRGHEVAKMQVDRDWPAFRRHGRYDFASFSQEKRFAAYLGAHSMGNDLGSSMPLIDLLLLEWRWPIPGRNTEADKGKPEFQPDLERQTFLLRYYTSCPKERRPRIVLWDMDHKLTYEDEVMLAGVGVHHVVETSVAPRQVFIPRTRVEPPIVTEDLLQHTPMPPNPLRKLVYVGSRYERDDVIDEWIKPVSRRYPGQVHFYGNWLRSLEECQALWPDVKYHDRIAFKDFRRAYGDAVACPLLAKRSYLETGFITPRIWEALIFGTIPVGLGTHRGIEEYLPNALIAKDPQHLGDIVEYLAQLGVKDRQDIRAEIARRIEFMDARHFIDTLERIGRRDQ